MKGREEKEGKRKKEERKKREREKKKEREKRKGEREEEEGEKKMQKRHSRSDCFGARPPENLSCWGRGAECHEYITRGWGIQNS